MASPFTLPHPSRRALGALITLALLLLTLPPLRGLGGAAVPAAAVRGGFEIDGDRPYQGTLTGALYDWAGTGANAAPNKATVNDPVDPVAYPDDDMFKPGNPTAKEGSYTQWEVINHSPAPPKDDVTQVEVAHKIVTPTTGAPVPWLWVDFTRAEGNGEAHLAFEFNKVAAGIPPTRSVGDILLAYDYTGTGQSEQVVVTGFRWDGSEWDACVGCDAYGTINGDRTYGEAAIDLTNLVNLGSGECTTFASFFVRSRTSGQSDTSELKDLIGPVSRPIPLCGQITVIKRDTDGRALSGAQFKLWKDVNGNGTLETATDTVWPSSTSYPNPCTTTSTGICTWGNLPAGKYLVEEVQPPAGYALPSNPVVAVDLAFLEHEHYVGFDAQNPTAGNPALTFVDPRIPYAIDVRENATNLVGDAHVFVVTLTRGDVGDTDPADNKFATRVPNATVALQWVRDAGADSAITQRVDANGTTSLSDLLSTTCITRVDDAGTVGVDEGGTCLITVNSATEGAGTLTATFTTPYQGATGSSAVWTSTAASIYETATKDWVIYSASVGDDSRNIVGDEHDFTITVDGPDGATLTGIEVGFRWKGTGTLTGATFVSSSATLGTLYECTVDASGQCTVTVDSPSTGTGTLTIEYINVGDIDGDGDEDFVLYDVDGSGTDDTTGTAVTTDQVATKTWVDYLATVDDDSVNLVGDPHTFTITAYELDGAGAPDRLATDGLEVRFTWTGTGSVSSGATAVVGEPGTYECTTATTTAGAGTCLVTVTSTATGLGTITVTRVDATGFVDGPTETVSLTAGADQIATKRWLDFTADVDDDSTNLVDDEHTFVVTGYELDGVGDPDALEKNGLDIRFTWSGVGSVTGGATLVSGNTYECTTSTTEGGGVGTCLVTVDSPDPGVGTITVISVDADDFVDGATSTVTLLPGDAQTATKTWLDFTADVDEDSTNLVGDSHTFTITAYELDGSGDPDGVATDGLEVEFTWTGAGMVTGGADPVVGEPGTYECTTATTTGGTGTCLVTVTSAVAGVGTITITAIDATGFVEGPTTTVDITAGDAQVATKTWISFDASVDDDATNLVGDTHEFTVTVTGPDGVDLSVIDVGLWWDGAGSVTNLGSAIDTDPVLGSLYECSVDVSGGCSVLVSSSAVGSGTLTIAYLDVDGLVDGVNVIEFDVDGDGDADTTGTAVTGDQQATKTWVDYDATVAPDGENLVGESHVFTISATVEDGDGDPDAASAAGVTVGFSWTGAGSVSDGATHVADSTWECITDGDGTCEVTVTSDATGTGTITILYVDATGFVDGDTTTVAFDVADDDQIADKTWIDYDVSISPEADENLSGSNHTFTITVLKDTGAGFEPLAGAVPTFAILSGPGAVVADGNDCLAGTDAAGECTVTISSAVPGLTTVRASFSGTAADSTATDDETADATKEWVTYAIAVGPDAVNPIGTTHTFTVELDRITDSDNDGVLEVVDVADETVALSLTGPGTIITVEPDGTIATDGRTGACVTDEAGTCDVTITSSTVGDTVLTAVFHAVVGDSEGDFQDGGLKEWRSNPAIQVVKDAAITPNAEGLKLIRCAEFVCPTTTFAFTVTNIGDVVLTDITLVDDKFGPLTLVKTTLAPGESTPATATYTPSRADIDAGRHDNLATVTGTAPDGEEVTDDDPETVFITNTLPEVILRPAIEVVKTADPVKVTCDENDVCPAVTYTYVITNTGESALVGVTLTDDKLGSISLPDTTLAPGESITVTKTYIPVEKDIGTTIVNVATATGVDPEGVTVRDDDDAQVEVVQVLPRVIARTGAYAVQLAVLALVSLATGFSVIRMTRRREA